MMSGDDEAVRVVKAGRAIGTPLAKLVSSPRVRVVTAEALDAIETVQECVEAAVTAAEDRLKAADDEADRIRETAREEGRADGLSEWMEMIEALHTERRRLVSEARDDMLKLAFRVAGQIVERTVEMEPRVVEGMVERALSHVRGESDVELRVHPDDRQVIDAARPTFEAELGGARIRVQEDDSVDRGGCILETDMNRVDARVGVQLDSLRAALGSARHNGSGGES